MGTRQAARYKACFAWKPVDKNGMPAVGVQLQALRMIAACGRSGADAYVPKVAATLTIVEHILRRREQVIIFSPFHEPLDVLSRRLTEAGVRHELLDGRKSQAARGRLAAHFKLGPPTVAPPRRRTGPRPARRHDGAHEK